MIYAMVELCEDGTSTGYIKIGFVSTDVPQDAYVKMRKRIISLQPGNPRRLRIIGACKGMREQEKALHAEFMAHRVKRPAMTEWLRIEGAVALWLETIRIEPIEAAQRVGAGSRGGEVPVKGANRCSICSSVEHTRARCADWNRLKRDGTKQRLRSDVFEWRGVIRATDRTGRTTKGRNVSELTRNLGRHPI
jgi:hypothetical protein